MIVAKGVRDPRVQMFLMFKGGTCFEIWRNLFTGAGGVDNGGEREIERYIASTGGKITGVYPRPSQD